MGLLDYEFDEGFNNVSEDERLYADALAHLLDSPAYDYIRLLEYEEVGFFVAAEPSAPYGDLMDFKKKYYKIVV